MDLQLIGVDGERGLAYLQSVLSGWGALSQRLALTVPEWPNARGFVLLPPDTVLTSERLDWSVGIRSDDATDLLVALLHGVSQQGATLVWDDPFLRWDDRVLSTLRARRFAIPLEDGVLFCIPPRCTKEDIEEVHLAAESAAGAVVAGTLTGIDCPIGPTDFETVVSAVGLVAVGVFDGDSYLIWLREPEQQLGQFGLLG